jgi:hypothetical protein
LRVPVIAQVRYAVGGCRLSTHMANIDIALL